MTIAGRIRAALVARAGAITIAAGYGTNMGLAVHRGVSPLVFSDADLAAGAVLIIGPAPDEQELPVQRVGRKLRNELRVQATALQLAGDAVPLDVADALLADLKRALLLPDQLSAHDGATLLSEPVEYGGSRYDLPGPGEQIVTVDMTITCRYAEAYGAPDTTLA